MALGFLGLLAGAEWRLSCSLFVLGIALFVVAISVWLDLLAGCDASVSFVPAWAAAVHV